MVQTTKEHSSYDYQALGLKCGLELHQQLETGRKLFCKCKTDLQLDEPMARITRHMRPTLSEMGENDKTALMEFRKEQIITYEVHDSTCTYEIDEAPPFEIDSNAIDLALTIARLLQMEILDELHVNRKQYLDGSIPAGFQRTMIVGVGGKVKISKRTINLDMLALEEDSCREITNIGRNIVWRVDRLGIPLVEIVTKTFNLDDPNEIKDIAIGISRILRATGKVKRGLGTIRQDLNISIEKGARVEIKGVQILDMLPEYIKLEVIRQLTLIEIKEEMGKRKLTAELFKNNYQDCKDIFKKTKCKFLITAIKNNFSQGAINFGMQKKVRCQQKIVGIVNKKVYGNFKPDTISITQIDGFCSKLRERISCFTRKARSFAKRKTGIETRLEIFSIQHNFIEAKKGITPAMQEGIIDKKLTWNDFFKIRLSTLN